MEEEKAAAYYDELTRKGSGAARFKQGLGFSSDVSSSAAAERGSALPSSSFLSSFVRASNSSSVKAEDTSDKHSQLQSIQNKLKKKHSGTSDADRGGRLKESERERSKEREREREISRDWEREKERDRNSRRRHRSRSSEKDRGADRGRRRRSRSRERDRDRYRSRRRGSRSRSLSDEDGRRRKDWEKGSCRDRSSSPGCRRLKKDGGDVKKKEYRLPKEDKKGAVDYAKLIKGYDQMTPGEKVKAKMKLQLSETAGKDTNMGSGTGWERFDFDKDAPIDNDNDEAIEGVGDDAAIVKRLGQSFRFSNVQARREQELKTAHDEAMFGAPATLLSPPITLEREREQSDEQKSETLTNESASNLLSEKVLAKQQGSWRDRARRKA